MSRSRYDLLGFGNAIVDIIAQKPDDFVAQHGMTKGAMTLIAEEPASALYASMGPTLTVSGGSAANTIIGAASFGCRTAFIGKVKQDPLGGRFAEDIKAAGVDFLTPADVDGPTTGCCFVIVTPDGQRTMNTFLGACQNLTEADVDADIVRGSRITYLEGYLWDPPAAKRAFVKAASLAHEADRQIALSLSDAFCVGRYRTEFLDLIRNGSVDILFANEAELKSLYEEEDFDKAVTQMRGEGVLAVVTRSEKGCVVLAKDGVTTAPAAPIQKLVDTTGAGDLFAAGFLTGLVRGQDHATCARLGALAAAEIIQHLGARSAVNLLELASRNGLQL
jgi:sugar/nucleoside kinase (ribokinase family)